MERPMICIRCRHHLNFYHDDVICIHRLRTDCHWMLHQVLSAINNISTIISVNNSLTSSNLYLMLFTFKYAVIKFLYLFLVWLLTLNYHIFVNIGFKAINVNEKILIVSVHYICAKKNLKSLVFMSWVCFCLLTLITCSTLISTFCSLQWHTLMLNKVTVI